MPALTFSSSRSSRASAACGVSPGSTLPPGNSHFSGCRPPRFRCAMRIFPFRIMTAATTCMVLGRLGYRLFAQQIQKRLRGRLESLLLAVDDPQRPVEGRAREANRRQALLTDILAHHAV